MSRVHITVSGPDHSKKGYIMVLIAEALRKAGGDVVVTGELDLHNEKFWQMAEEPEKVAEQIAHQNILISSMRTA